MPREPLPPVVDQAHLVDPAEGRYYAMVRYPVPGDLTELARSYWVPAWAFPPGRIAEQRVLQRPVCLIVIADTYARWYGVASGLSRTVLGGNGWAVGLMLQPAAGYLATRRPVREFTDRYVDLRQIASLPGSALIEQVRAVMAPDPRDPARHESAMRSIETALRPIGPVDAEGARVNDIVELVESDPLVRRVADLCERFGIAERTLQRLLLRRVGTSARWLICRRRLHEGSLRMQTGETDLAGLAHDLGYADQAHFTRDFRTVTGLTPGRFAGRFRG